MRGSKESFELGFCIINGLPLSVYISCVQNFGFVCHLERSDIKSFFGAKRGIARVAGVGGSSKTGGLSFSCVYVCVLDVSMLCGVKVVSSDRPTEERPAHIVCGHCFGFFCPNACCCSCGCFRDFSAKEEERACASEWAIELRVRLREVHSHLHSLRGQRRRRLRFGRCCCPRIESRNLSSHKVQAPSGGRFGKKKYIHNIIKAIIILTIISRLLAVSLFKTWAIILHFIF